MPLVLVPEPPLPHGITHPELDLWREEQLKWLLDRGRLERKMQGEGNDDPYYLPLREDVPVRISAGYGTFRQVADRFQGLNIYALTFMYDEDVAPDDKLIDADGNEYHIKVVRNHSSIQTATQTIAELVT